MVSHFGNSGVHVRVFPFPLPKNNMEEGWPEVWRGSYCGNPESRDVYLIGYNREEQQGQR
jgi:hypothetical protein